MRVLTAAEQELTARRCHAERAEVQNDGQLGAAQRAGKMIAASDALASAVQALLAEQGHVVEVGAAVTDPENPHAGRVVALELRWADREAAVPITPGSTTLRVWAGRRSGFHGRIIELNEPLADLTAPGAENDGWVPAATLAALLADDLTPA